MTKNARNARPLVSPGRNGGIVLKNAQQLFVSWWSSVDRGHVLTKRHEAVRFNIVRGAQHRFIARVIPASRYRPLVFEISADFLEVLLQDVLRNADALVGAVLLERAGGWKLRRQLTAAVFETATSFLMLHEIFHVCCGHVGWFRKQLNFRESSSAYDELNMGWTSHGGLSRLLTSAELRSSRYRELEADSSALQWLMRCPPLVSWQSVVARVLGSKTHLQSPPTHLVGLPRRLAFALLLNATWLVTAALERQRFAALALGSGENVLRSSRDTHPYPMARLLAATSTILEQFAEFSTRRTDESGMKVQRLSASQAGEAKTFMTEIFRLTLTAPWREPPGAAAALGGALSPPAVIQEFGRILLRQKAQSEAGKELARLQRLRRQQRLVYKSYRCVPREI